jgi:hypothetical protein
VTFAIGGAVIGFAIALARHGDTVFLLFPLFASLSGYLTARLFWWLLVGKRPRPAFWRYVGAGVLTGIASHPPCWWTFISTLWCIHELTGKLGGSLGEGPMNPAEAVPGALVFSALSLLFVGWATVGLGLVAGALLHGTRPR